MSVQQVTWLSIVGNILCVLMDHQSGTDDLGNRVLFKNQTQNAFPSTLGFFLIGVICQSTGHSACVNWKRLLNHMLLYIFKFYIYIIIMALYFLLISLLFVDIMNIRFLMSQEPGWWVEYVAV